MGLFTRRAVLDAAISDGTNFVVDSDSIAAQIFGLATYEDAAPVAPRISRREAIQCPPLKRARDLICGSLGSLPLYVTDSENVEMVNDLIDQFERGIPRTVTMTWLVEDMLFEGCAFLVVTERAFDGYPRWCKRVHPSRVDINDDNGQVRIDGKVTDPASVIQFHSPNDAMLCAGARAIRDYLRIAAAASNYSDGTPPIEYFKPTDVSPFADNDEAQEFLNAWKNKRRKGGTALIPDGLDYVANSGWSPEQLQLSAAREACAVELARVSGIDSEELSVSTTSRTYFNAFDRNKNFIDRVLGPYRAAIEERLSMGDVTKRGYRVRFDLDSLLRSDVLTRMQSYEIGLRVGAIAPEEIRAQEGRPALPTAPAPAPAALPAPEVPQP